MRRAALSLCLLSLALAPATDAVDGAGVDLALGISGDVKTQPALAALAKVATRQ